MIIVVTMPPTCAMCLVVLVFDKYVLLISLTINMIIFVFKLSTFYLSCPGFSCNTCCTYTPVVCGVEECFQYININKYFYYFVCNYFLAHTIFLICYLISLHHGFYLAMLFKQTSQDCRQDHDKKCKGTTI